MKTSTHALRRLVRNVGLALAVTAVAAPVAEAAKAADYAIESFRVPANVAATYDAIESHRMTRPPETGSLAYELGRDAQQTASQLRYDGIELVRARPVNPPTRLAYDGIELVRSGPSRSPTRLAYDGIEVARSGQRADFALPALASTRASDWTDAATGALVGLMIGLGDGSAGRLIAGRRAGFAAS